MLRFVWIKGNIVNYTPPKWVLIYYEVCAVTVIGYRGKWVSDSESMASGVILSAAAAAATCQRRRADGRRKTLCALTR